MRNIIEQSVLPSVSSATSLRCHVMGGTQTKDQGVQRTKELCLTTVTWGDAMEGLDFKLELRSE